jgi:hypothetical protein
MAELTRRYVVMTMAAEAPFDPSDPDTVFVLKPWKDPAALRALAVYRDNCYPELGRDIDAWIRVIAAGPVVRGDVGRRNEAHVKAADGPGARPAPPRPARVRRARPQSRRPASKRKSPAPRKKRRR